MRVAVSLAMVVLAACASDKLALTPPAGVDLSGHWQLNAADSDDPQRLLQSQLAAATAGAGPGGTTQTPSGGRGGRQGGRGGGGGGFGNGGPLGPATPSVAALDEALRWPGRGLSIKQSGGVVTFTSDGGTRECRPASSKAHHHRSADDPSHGRDTPAQGRGDAPPPACGWDQATLVVQSGDPEDDHPPFEQRFSVSEDGERLVELVLFKSGRSAGFTASREWDRLPASASTGAPPNSQAPDPSRPQQ
jgi:hypothetical protein